MTHRPILLLASFLLMPALGCDLESTVDADRASSWLDGAGEPEGHERRREPPPEGLLRLAIHVGALGEEPAMQEALELRQAIDDEARGAHETFHLSLADAVAARAIEEEEFDDSIAALARIAAQQGEALEHALDTAHALLDEAERAEAVDLLPPPPAQGEHPPMSAEGGAPEGGARPGGAGPGGAGPGGAGPGRLVEALELDEAQHEALRAALGEPVPPERPTPPDLGAFADASFTAASLGAVEHHQQHVRERAEHEVELLAALVPLLDDAQLSTLEELLRTGPTRERERA